MRILQVIFLFFIFTGTTLNAQENVLFGVKGGVSITNMTYDFYYDKNNRKGFHLGLLAEFPIANKVSIQPEILYATQGAEVDWASVLYDKTEPIFRKYTLDYIQIPVLVKIYLLRSLSVEVGPSFNFLLKEEIDRKEKGYGSNFEFGGAFGASYKIIGGFFGNARYTIGFTDAVDDKLNSLKNNGFQAGIGLMF